MPSPDRGQFIPEKYSKSKKESSQGKEREDIDQWAEAFNPLKTGLEGAATTDPEKKQKLEELGSLYYGGFAVPSADNTYPQDQKKRDNSFLTSSDKYTNEDTTSPKGQRPPKPRRKPTSKR